MVVVIDPNDKHNAAVPAPVSDDVIVIGPAYQIRGPMSMMWSRSDDVMAMVPAYQLNPYGSLHPASCEQANPVIFKPSRQPSGKPIPSTDFQTQQAAEYQLPAGPVVIYPCWTTFVDFL